MFASNPADFGAIVRQRRLDLQLSQTDVADKIGTTRQWMSRFEKGNTDVSLARALAILRELDMTVDLRPRKHNVNAGAGINSESMRRVAEAISATLPPVKFGEMEPALNKIAALFPPNPMSTSDAAATFGPLAEYLSAHGEPVTTQLGAPLETAITAMSETARNPAPQREAHRDEEHE